ncbi:MAG: hypothetical protein KUG65_00045 [Sphingomonadaceae bacterium]|nr:hypothetical protein [Sphingomonadaceae bacterium]
MKCIAGARSGRFTTRAALAAALALGVVVSGAAAPDAAVAAKKKKKKAPKLSYSKGFIAAAQPAQKAVNAVTAGDAQSIAAAAAAVDAAFAAVEKEDDRFMAGSLALTLGGKAKDPARQRMGIKTMLSSGKTTPAMGAQLQSAAGQLAYQAKDYADAIYYLAPLVQAGGSDSTNLVFLAESYMASNQVDLGLSAFESAINQSKISGTLAPVRWYRRALTAAFKSKNAGWSTRFGTMLITDYPSPQNIGVAVTVLRETGDFGSKETLDLMRLMGRSKSYVEQRDYVEYIQAADPRRLPGEVLDVINAGLAAGMLSEADTFVSDAKAQASGRIRADKASLKRYAADARNPSAKEGMVSGAADALLSYGDAAAAAQLYAIALTKPGVDTGRALTRLGITQFDQGNYADAQATFGKVTGLRKPIAELWSAYAASKAVPEPAADATPVPAPN